MTEISKASFVIVGGGIAGASCLEGLSFFCPDKTIILITASPLVKTTTNAVALTKTLTLFDVEEKSHDTLSALYPNLTVIQSAVTQLHSNKHLVTIENGREVEYEKLCICTGGSPKLIAKNNPYIIGIRDTESVKEFVTRIKNARKIVIVGNGGIATEIIHEVEGIEMVWVVKDRHISATFVDPGAAEFFRSKLAKTESKSNREPEPVKRHKYTVSEGSSDPQVRGAALGPDWHRNFNISPLHHETSKVTVEYECEIKDVITNEGRPEKDHWPVHVELTNGKVVGCDFVVSATGVIPNTSVFLDGNELQVAEDGGLKVDWKLETSIPDVFAAGDVCSAAWDTAAHWFQMRLWTQARQMGMYAAKAMAGSLKGEEILQDFCFELFSHATHFFGFKVILLGLFNGQKLNGQYEVLLRMTKGVEYIKLVMKDGKMQGALLIGETDLEEMCENLILNQLDLSAYGEDLLNPDIDIEDYFD